MDKLHEEREFKINRILEEYDKRKTQKEVADLFRMDKRHVSLVTQENNYFHTRKITQENVKDGEIIKPISFYDSFGFLDVYPLENFIK